jgi:hypothetical protein
MKLHHYSLEDKNNQENSVVGVVNVHAVMQNGMVKSFNPQTRNFI